MFANFGHQFVVFAVIRGIFAEFRTVVVVFCGICWFQDSDEHLWPSGPVKVPFRSVCGDEPVCALLKFAFFL